ncbi:Leucine-rich repeat-containing N-terminal, type 2 [Spatholobus suberectus]|nr:Leucine-rich repeat-containing N-terminal, type 2 [Spatholobus suberectus]
MASSFFFLTLLLLTVFSVVTPCPPSEGAALLAFKAALTEPYLGIFQPGRAPNVARSWYGVACDPPPATSLTSTSAASPKTQSSKSLAAPAT